MKTDELHRGPDLLDAANVAAVAQRLLVLQLSLLVALIPISGGIENRLTLYNVIFVGFVATALAAGLFLRFPLRDLAMMLAFAAVALLSFVVSGAWPTVKGGIDILTVVTALIFSIALSSQMRERDLTTLRLAFVFLFLAVSVFSFSEYFFDRNLLHGDTRVEIEGRVSGGSSVGVPIGGYLSVVCFPFVYLTYRRRPVALALAGFVALANIYLSGQRMALVLFVTHAVLLTLCSRRGRRTVVLWLVAGIALIGVMGGDIEARITRLAADTLIQEQSTKRIEIWTYALEIVRERPLLGLGLNDFESAYSRLASPGDEAYAQQHPHSLYLHIAGQFGLLGLWWFVVVIFGAVIRSASIADPETRAFGLMMLNAALSPVQVTHGLNEIWLTVVFIALLSTALALPRLMPASVLSGRRKTAPAGWYGSHTDAFGARTVT